MLEYGISSVCLTVTVTWERKWNSYCGRYGSYHRAWVCDSGVMTWMLTLESCQIIIYSSGRTGIFYLRLAWVSFIMYLMLNIWRAWLNGHLWYRCSSQKNAIQGIVSYYRHWGTRIEHWHACFTNYRPCLSCNFVLGTVWHHSSSSCMLLLGSLLSIEHWGEESQRHRTVLLSMLEFLMSLTSLLAAFHVSNVCVVLCF